MKIFMCPPEHQHAAAWTCYSNHRCRCADCKNQHRIRANEYRARVREARKRASSDEPHVATSAAHVQLTLAPADARLVAAALADRARLIHTAAGNAGANAPIARARAQRTYRLADQLVAAAERIRR